MAKILNKILNKEVEILKMSAEEAVITEWFIPGGKRKIAFATDGQVYPTGETYSFDECFVVEYIIRNARRILVSDNGNLKYFVATTEKLTKADWMWLEQGVVYGL